jgi:homoserine O-succinyltransferase
MIDPLMENRLSQYRSELVEPGGYGPSSGLTIALINNMPDAALEATERQFCALLSAASGNMLVRLKLYSTPGIARTDASRTHIERCYEDFVDLRENPPDGIIVTGTEPSSKSLRDEPYWPALSWLVEWVDRSGIPSIWSCLGAHAAVLEMDGIERHALGDKLFGLFECQISSHKHHIVHGLPTRWRVPHSRLYGLRESALISAGYSILSQSRDVGPDIFLRQGRALQLFFQGHPEYRATTLASEYRRDVGRFLSGVRGTYPAMPVNQYGATVASRFARIANHATRTHALDTLATFDAAAAEISFEDCWSREARRIYFNWLSYVSDRRLCTTSQLQFSTAVTEPSHLGAHYIPVTQPG